MKLLKLIPWWLKLPVTGIGFVIGCYMTVETWVISKANTVVEPVTIKVNAFTEYSKIHQERVERELMMIRSSQEEVNKYLRSR